jgi:drug/metabolite transporter (DMT)-like permease
MIVSAISLVASVALMIIFVARRGDGVHMAYAHMGMAALVAVGFAASFFKSNNALRESGASQSAIAASTTRHVGYVWGWGAACLLTIYTTGILSWREWPHFTAACVILSAGSLLLARMLQRDADNGKEDAAMLKLAHRLAVVLLVGMIITILGFLIDGKMVRFLNPRFTDWPANNVFFFGAVAMAAISGYALKHKAS